MADQKVTLGKRIAQAREAKGMSQKELAKKVDYDPSGVSIARIEGGVIYQPSDEKLRKLAEHLDLEYEELKLLAVKPEGRRPLSGPKLHKANIDRRRALEREIEDFGSALRLRYQPLDEVRGKVEDDFLKVLFDLTQRVEGIPATKRSDIEVRKSAGRARPNSETEQLLDDYFAKLAAAIAAQVAAGFAAGAALGAGGAAATYSAVGAIATASTGTAISSLSGIAASNATLAAIGGGALSAGGWGIVGGTVVLGLAAALPALALGGFTLVRGGGKWTETEDKVAAALKQAEDEFNAQKKRIEGSFEWVTKATAFLTLALQRGQDRIGRLGRLSPTDGVTYRWADLTEAEQDALRELLALATITFSVLPLPVIATANPDQNPDEIKELEDTSRKWNDAVITEALAWFAR